METPEIELFPCGEKLAFGEVRGREEAWDGYVGYSEKETWIANLLSTLSLVQNQHSLWLWCRFFFSWNTSDFDSGESLGELTREYGGCSDTCY